MKLVPQPKVKTKEDIKMYFKARKVKFLRPSALQKELYRQLGILEILEPIQSVEDMAHEKSELGFLLTLKNQDYVLKYQYRDSKIEFKNGQFLSEFEKLKKGFCDFDGEEICSFIEYCVEDEIEFQILCTKPINKDLLISKI